MRSLLLFLLFLFFSSGVTAKQTCTNGFCRYCSTIVNGQTYIFGGFEDRLIFSNILARDWYVLESSNGEIPPARAGCMLDYHRGNLYLTGGFGQFGVNHQYNDLWAYDLHDNQWRSLEPIDDSDPQFTIKDQLVYSFNYNEPLSVTVSNEGKSKTYRESFDRHRELR